MKWKLTELWIGLRTPATRNKTTEPGGGKSYTRKLNSPGGRVCDTDIQGPKRRLVTTLLFYVVLFPECQVRFLPSHPCRREGGHSNTRRSPSPEALKTGLTKGPRGYTHTK